jgi:predicted membrane GTPase involved in stress response
LFDSYRPAHDIDTSTNQHGSLIASEAGTSSAYGLNNAQDRGVLFIGPAVEVYMGMVVGNKSNSGIMGSPRPRRADSTCCLKA